MCRTESQAREALRRIGLVMSRLGLKLHPEKTRMMDLRGRKGPLCFWAARFERSGAYNGNRACTLCSGGHRPNKAVVANADFQGGGAGIVNTGGAILLGQRQHTQNAAHGGLASLVEHPPAERADCDPVVPPGIPQKTVPLVAGGEICAPVLAWSKNQSRIATEIHLVSANGAGPRVSQTAHFRSGSRG